MKQSVMVWNFHLRHYAPLIDFREFVISDFRAVDSLLVYPF